jgi:hypothetical protein
LSGFGSLRAGYSTRRAYPSGCHHIANWLARPIAGHNNLMEPSDIIITAMAVIAAVVAIAAAAAMGIQPI